jgi:hypothetical protein
LLAGRQAGRKYNNCQPKKSSWELVGGDFQKKKKLRMEQNRKKHGMMNKRDLLLFSVPLS